MQGVLVGIQQLDLGFVLLGNQGLDDRRIHVEQVRERADVHGVLEQLALAWVVVGGIADFGQRHADGGDILAEARFRQGFAVVVKQVTAGFDFLDVGVPGLRVHGDHQINTATATQPTLFVDAHFVPGGQALDVGGEDVARADRHTHAQDRFGEHLVGGGRTRAIDVGELDDEIVGGGDGGHALALLRPPAGEGPEGG